MRMAGRGWGGGGALTGPHKQVAASLPREPAVMMRRGGAAGA